MRLPALLLVLSLLIAAFPCHVQPGGVSPLKHCVSLAALDVCSGTAAASVAPDAASIPEYADTAVLIPSGDLQEKADFPFDPYLKPCGNERPPEA